MGEEFSPNIIAFLCNWCAYGGADLAGTSRIKMPPTVKVVRVMCSSRVDPVMVLSALLWGADGVIVAGCHPGDCHYQEGNYYARRRFALLKRLLEAFDLEPERIELAWVSASEGRRYAELVERFTEKIKKLGPNPFKRSVF